MTKIKYDVSGVNPEEARSRGGDREQAPKGSYRAKIIDAEAGFARGEDGQPDKSRPNVKLTMEPRKGGKTFGYVWNYLTFGESAQWKMWQFLDSLGLPTGKAGTFDTDKVKGKDIGLVLRDGTDLNGERRPEVSAFIDPKTVKDKKSSSDEDEEEEEDAEEEEDDVEEEDEDESEDDEDDDDEESEDEDEDEEEGYTEDQLKAMKPSELKDLAKSLKVKVKKDAKKSAIVKAIIDSQDEGLPF